MKKFLPFIILFVFACNESNDGEGNLQYIHQWQREELSCPDIDSPCYITGDFFNDLTCLFWQYNTKFIWIEESKWKTSCQFIGDKFGNCIGFAHTAYRTIINSKLIEYYDIDVRMRCIDDGTKHMIVVIYYNNQVYEIDTYFIVSDHESEYRILYEYDLSSVF